jgi:glycosyltransferase involved in cell wall biosynthesis
VFINGHGGYLGRKGGGLVQRLRHNWPDIPIAVYSQKKLDWASTSSPESNAELYTEGDVLLVPHSVDGIGLEILEAAASGMPVISTNGNPWNEYPALDRINSRAVTKKIGRSVDWYLPDAHHLLLLCQKWLGKDISEASLAARQWAEQRSWEQKKESFRALVEAA